MLMDRLCQRLSSGFKVSSPETLKQLILSLNPSIEDAYSWLRDPEDKPYGRALIYADNDFEIIVMTWSRNLPSLPHDHGSSYGWVKILSGSVVHTLYRHSEQGVPTVAKRVVEPTGAMLYAPPGLIHTMESATPDETVVTLHFYAPPIHGMRVFDLERIRACIVSDDCGAWWPDRQHFIQELPIP